MKLVIFNGSPRNKNSNSTLLTEQFLQGYGQSESEKVPVHYLANIKKMPEAVELFKTAEQIIVIFPLYADSMPGIVKEFIEAIAVSEFESPQKLGFIVHSGFPEAIQSTFVERYLEKLSRRLKVEYLGTVIKGASEGIRIMPPVMTRKLYSRFQALGKYFAETGSFSEEIKDQLAQPFKLKGIRLLIAKFMSNTSVGNFYWNSNLKKNEAFINRFDRPYVSD